MNWHEPRYQELLTSRCTIHASVDVLEIVWVGEQTVLAFATSSNMWLLEIPSLSLIMEEENIGPPAQAGVRNMVNPNELGRLPMVSRSVSQMLGRTLLACALPPAGSAFRAFAWR